MTRSLLAAALAFVLIPSAPAREPIRLPNHPALSPDGKTLAFDWNGDIWTASVEGGLARPLTSHPAKDTSPRFSPDGKEIAFVSERDGVASGVRYVGDRWDAPADDIPRRLDRKQRAGRRLRPVRVAAGR